MPATRGQLLLLLLSICFVGDAVAERHISLQINVPVHTSDVKSLEFVGQAQLCSAGADKHVLVWNVEQPAGQGPRLRHARTIWWDVEQGPLGSIADIAVAPNRTDGPAVVFGGQSSRGGNSELVWANLGNGQQVRYVNSAMQPGAGENAAPVGSVSTLSDGSLTAVTDSHCKTILYPLDGPPRLLYEPNADVSSRSRTSLGVTSCSAITSQAVFVPEFVQTRVLGPSQFPVWKIVAYDTATGQRSEPFRGVLHHAVVTAMAASSDGRYLAIADLGATGNGVVHYWDLTTYQHAEFPIGDGYGVSLAFSGDGRLLAIGTEGRNNRSSRLVVLDLASGQPTTASRTTHASVLACALSNDGSLLAFSQGSEILVGRSDNSSPISRVPGGTSVVTVAGEGGSARPASVVVSAMLEGNPQPVGFEFDVATLSLREMVAPPAKRPFEIPGWQFQNDAGRMRVIQSKTGTTFLDVGSPGVVTALEYLFTPERQLLGVAVGTNHGEIMTYRFQQRGPARQFVGHAGGVTDLAVSADGRYLISGSVDGTTRFWALQNWHVADLQTRWGATISNQQNRAVVDSIDDRGPLYHAGVRAGDTLERMIWDDASAQLGLGKPIEIEGHARSEATEAAEILAALERVPASHHVAFYLSRQGEAVRVPVQAKSNWHEVLALYVRNPDWIAWNPSGYYASSPGGERLIGWLVNGRDQVNEQGVPDPTLEKPAPEFHLAIQFRKAMYKPDAIRRLLEFGNLTDALAASEQQALLAAVVPVAPQVIDTTKQKNEVIGPQAEDISQTTPPRITAEDAAKQAADQASAESETDTVTKTPPSVAKTKPPAEAAVDTKVADAVFQPKRVVDLLPPRVKILSPTKQDLTSTEATIVIEAEAISDSRRPVKSMRLMVNSGPDELSIRELDPTSGVAQRGLIREVKYPSQRWEITLGAGTHEFVIRADCGDGEYATYGLSETIRVTYKDSRAKMYVLAVGISDYPGELELKYAHSDAEGFVQTLQTHAEGKSRPYESVTAKVLPNEQATRENVLEGITWLGDQLQMGDLGVIFFAGHGARQDGSFYLLPIDGKLDDLANTAISQADIRNFCANTSGGARRLLVIDACYSGALNPAESFRELNSDDFGVFIMTSSKDDERSWEMDDLRGGVFTSWMNRGLSGDARYGDDFVDDWELGKYVLTSVSGFVKKRFQSRQTPLFMRPETSLPFMLTRPRSDTKRKN